VANQDLSRTEGEVRQAGDGGGSGVDPFRTFGSARAPTPAAEAPATGPLRHPSAANIYLASSWRNKYQPSVLAFLRGLGCEVYDFRNPAPGNNGFRWTEIDPDWLAWDPARYRDALRHPIAQAGFHADFAAMQACNTCVLLLPSGRSASFEFGWCVGAGKRGIVYIPEPCEPELMYAGTEIVTDLDELRRAFE